MLNNIQALRAFAALNVVLFHIIGTSASYNQGVVFFDFFKGWGQNGVDIFFVVSGFIMVYIQDKKSRTASSFLYNRIVRITPIYWLLTILLYGIYLIAPAAFRELQLNFLHVLSSLTFTSAALGFAQPVLYVGWTLEYEMLFYVLFSFGLIFKSKHLSFLVPIFILFTTCYFGLTDLIALEFVLGMICAKLYLSERYNHLGLYSFAVGALLLSATVFYKIGIDRFFIYGIPSFFIVFGLVNMHQIKSKFWVYLGDASYSIYLVQVFTITVFYKIASKINILIPTDLVAILALLFTTIVGCALYSLVERNISKFIRKLSDNNYRKSVAT